MGVYVEKITTNNQDLYWDFLGVWGNYNRFEYVTWDACYFALNGVEKFYVRGNSCKYYYNNNVKTTISFNVY